MLYHEYGHDSQGSTGGAMAPISQLEGTRESGGYRSSAVAAGLQRLAATVSIKPYEADGLIPLILALIGESLDVDATILARIEDARLYHFEYIHDRADVGILPGFSMNLCDTICAALVSDDLPSLTVADARSDPRFRRRPVVRAMGVCAYSGTPLYRADGRLYGTLCTAHRQTRAISTDETVLLALAGRIVMQVIEAEEARARERQLSVELATAEQAQHVLRRQALHDALTGLPNRTLFYDRAEQALRRAERYHAAAGASDTLAETEGMGGANGSVALLVLDLDRFKDVNDTLGHHYGDLLLQQVAIRARGALRAGDTVARLGGDEFAVLLPTTDTTGAVEVAHAILAALDAPVILKRRSVAARASIGIAVYPEHGCDVSTLLQQADAAMYAAKRAGGGYYVAVESRKSKVDGR